MGVMTQLLENEFKRSLGLRIMVQRQKMHMSQKELGARIGVSGQQMQKYENGINSMSPHRLALCAEILGKPVGYFYGDGEDGYVPTSSNILRIAAEIDQLPEEGMDVILNMMQNLTRVAELCQEVERRQNVA
jgi:transcriptional regulator with XRE-family HTH domain